MVAKVKKETKKVTKKVAAKKPVAKKVTKKAPAKKCCGECKCVKPQKISVKAVAPAVQAPAKKSFWTKVAEFFGF